MWKGIKNWFSIDNCESSVGEAAGSNPKPNILNKVKLTENFSISADDPKYKEFLVWKTKAESEGLSVGKFYEYPLGSDPSYRLHEMSKSAYVIGEVNKVKCYGKYNRTSHCVIVCRTERCRQSYYSTGEALEHVGLPNWLLRCEKRGIFPKSRCPLLSGLGESIYKSGRRVDVVDLTLFPKSFVSEINEDVIKNVTNECHNYLISVAELSANSAGLDDTLIPKGVFFSWEQKLPDPHHLSYGSYRRRDRLCAVVNYKNEGDLRYCPEVKGFTDVRLYDILEDSYFDVKYKDILNAEVI